MVKVAFVANFMNILAVKEFEDRFTFGKVTTKITVASFCVSWYSDYSSISLSFANIRV